ncbi:MAG: sialate O-acetylesterase, partial [Phycisphaerae bacterium]|nr:sialate O-acetylesterase [Phycisphaerae bacterium]
GQEKTATAGEDGAWSVRLDPLKANDKPAEMRISDGTQKVSFTDVLVGEVWLCSGQSNMEKPIGVQRGQKPIENAEEEIQKANHPLIRLLPVPKAKNVATSAITWSVCTPQSIDQLHFSATAYFFGRSLQDQLHVPIGLIQSSWGGTRIEPWTTPAGYQGVPELKQLDGEIQARQPTTRNASLWRYGDLYHNMIEPMVPYAIRGVIWYQGESNVMTHDRSAYFQKMQALIGGWRLVWHEGDFPFYFVELAPYTYSHHPNEHLQTDELPLVWEAQEKAMSISHTGMAATSDLVSNTNDIHPTRKREVGERLALWALKYDYGRSDIVCCGPTFKSVDFKDGEAVVHFDNVADGLVSRDGKPLSDFTIAGADGKFVQGTARIDGDTVIVTSDQVKSPTAVRFGWNEVAMPNLSNKSGLPALPFRNDATH